PGGRRTGGVHGEQDDTRAARRSAAGGTRRLRDAHAVGETLRARTLRRSHHVLQPQSGLERVPRACLRDPRRRPRRHRRGRRRVRMQLSGGAQPVPHPASGLSAFARTLTALVVITVPVLAGVPPDDRADVLWHVYNGGDITVEGPELLVRKKVGDSLSLTAGYYEDMISSASIDVKLSASPYHETRKQENAGLDYQHGKTTYSVGYIHSREPDYIADTTFY